MASNSIHVQSYYINFVQFFESESFKKNFSLQQVNTLYEGKCYTLNLRQKSDTSTTIAIFLNDIWANDSSTNNCDSKNKKVSTLNWSYIDRVWLNSLIIKTSSKQPSFLT